MLLKYSAVIFLLSANCLASPSPRGVVSPVTNCGGLSDLRQLRVDDCTTPPCELIPERPYSLEVDFIAGSTVPHLALRLTVIQDDGTETPVWESIAVGGGIEQGQLYTLQYPLTPNAVLQGQLFDLRFEIFEAFVTNPEDQVCLECPVTIV